MMKNIKTVDIFESLKTLFSKLKNTVWFLGIYSSLLLTLFIFLSFLLAGIVFYKYVYLVEKKEAIISQDVIKFDNTAYQEILERFQLGE